jgi:hypothetical protein
MRGPHRRTASGRTSQYTLDDVQHARAYAYFSTSSMHTHTHMRASVQAACTRTCMLDYEQHAHAHAYMHTPVKKYALWLQLLTGSTRCHPTVRPAHVHTLVADASIRVSHELHTQMRTVAAAPSPSYRRAGTSVPKPWRPHRRAPVPSTRSAYRESQSRRRACTSVPKPWRPHRLSSLCARSPLYALAAPSGALALYTQRLPWRPHRHGRVGVLVWASLNRDGRTDSPLYALTLL